LDLPIMKEKKSRKTNFPEVRPLFGPLCTKSAKIRPQICLAALLFLYAPFLSYAAEYWPAGNMDCIGNSNHLNHLSEVDDSPPPSRLREGR
jgi:hypothetical protein